MPGSEPGGTETVMTLTPRGERALTAAVLLGLLLIMAVVGGIEQGTLL